MPSGQRRVHPVSRRHDDDRCWNTHGVFLISDLYRVDTETAEVNADIARRFLKSILPCYLKRDMLLPVKLTILE